MPSPFDALLTTIISRATSEIASAVRANIADEIARVARAQVPGAPGARVVPAAPRVGRKPRVARGRAGPAVPAAPKRAWPTCTKAGCSSNVFGASGEARLCYQHFLEAGGKHPRHGKWTVRAAGMSAKQTAGPTAKAPRKRATTWAGKGGGGTQASGGEALLGRVLDLIAKTPGLRAEEVSKQLGAKPEAVKEALAELRASGRVKVSGKARGTRYRVA